MYGQSRADRSSGQYVVPIGGAPFVQPLRTMMDASMSPGTTSSSSDVDLSYSSPTSRGSSASSSPTTSTTDEAVFGGGAIGSPSRWQAALQYSSALHEHTRKMWETERMNIERARLGLDVDEHQDRNNRSSAAASSSSGRHGRRGSAAAAVPASSTMTASNSNGGLQKRSTISGSVDALFRGRSRRQNKQSGIL